MVKSYQKRGRPQGIYRTSWGDQIVGLIRLADGRWQAKHNGKIIRWTEADERLAIARFRKLQSEETGATASLPVSIAATPDTIGPALNKAARQAIEINIPADWRQPTTVHRVIESAEIWGWLREQIISNPKHVAQMTGIEQIAYLNDIIRPAESPTLAEMIETYANKPGLTSEQQARIRGFWVEFGKVVGIKTIRELTHEQIEEYEKAINRKGLSPKSVKHRFTGIKTVVAYNLKRGKGQADCRRALDKMKMLEIEGSNTLDPHPIAPDDFWKIHRAAVKAGDNTFAASMIFALNAALYPSEVGAVKWDDIDMKRGEFVTRRNKTKVPRVAVLWPETIKAIKTLDQTLPTVFNTTRQAYSRFSMHRKWEQYRTAAKIKGTVTFAMIRDASFTTACRTSLDQARVLAGHRLPGAADHYVMRDPQFVKSCCDAIRKAYMK